MSSVVNLWCFHLVFFKETTASEWHENQEGLISSVSDDFWLLVTWIWRTCNIIVINVEHTEMKISLKLSLGKVCCFRDYLFTNSILAGGMVRHILTCRLGTFLAIWWFLLVSSEQLSVQLFLITFLLWFNLLFFASPRFPKPIIIPGKRIILGGNIF